MSSVQLPALEFEQDLQPRATCEDCAWQMGPARQTRENALRHVKVRRHRVRITVEHLEFWRPEARDG